jgi:GntR family transcriptional regulator
MCHYHGAYGAACLPLIPLLRSFGPGGMYSRLEELGHRIRFEESVTCRLPTDEEQEQLKVKLNEPVLVLWRRSSDQNNQILDLTHRLVVGNRQELVYRCMSRAANTVPVEGPSPDVDTGYQC